MKMQSPLSGWLRPRTASLCRLSTRSPRHSAAPTSARKVAFDSQRPTTLPSTRARKASPWSPSSTAPASSPSTSSSRSRPASAELRRSISSYHSRLNDEQRRVGELRLREWCAGNVGVESLLGGIAVARHCVKLLFGAKRAALAGSRLGERIGLVVPRPDRHSVGERRRLVPAPAENTADGTHPDSGGSEVLSAIHNRTVRLGIHNLSAKQNDCLSETTATARTRRDTRRRRRWPAGLARAKSCRRRPPRAVPAGSRGNHC